MSTSAWRTRAAAPASTPHVGWWTTTTRGSRSSSRPTTNFCRFPPESALASGFSRLVRTSKRELTRAATVRASRRLTKPPLTIARSLVCRVRSTFSESAKPGAALCPSRSSGTKAAPSRRRAVTPSRPQGVPAMPTAPGAGARRSPERASNSSDCPFPATPAIATTSPARTSSDNDRRATPNGPSAGRVRSATASITGPSPACASVLTVWTSAPTISRAREAAVSAWGSTSAATRPSRRMVASWQSCFTSSSRWEM